MGTRTRSKSRPVVLENIVDTGTEGTKVASGTTAQRGSGVGQFRYNSTTGKFEGRNASSFVLIEATPLPSSVDDTEVDSAGGGNQTIVITGTNFATGDMASFIGTSANFNATTTTVDSGTQITAVAPKASFLNAQEPYGVRVTSSGGLAGTFDTNNLTVLYGSSKIQGDSSNLVVSTERAGFALVYYNSTQGWLLTEK